MLGLRRRAGRRSSACIAVAALALAGCAPGNTAASGSPGAAPAENVVSHVVKDERIAALLPARIRQAGVLRVASTAGGPPSSFYTEDNKTLVGQDIDISEAVARVLGLRIDREVASFESILPALAAGKYDVGTGNFGVTEERKKTIDFVTYIDDGQAFAVRQDSKLGPVTDLVQLCGLVIGTGAGTTFEATLEENRHVCADAGKKPYEIRSFSENSATYLALRQGRIDVIMSTINGLRHAASRQPGLKFLNEYRRLDVGLAVKKGSPLAKPLQAAINKLIEDGTYARILRKWGTQGSAIPESRINPPELKAPGPGGSPGTGRTGAATSGPALGAARRVERGPRVGLGYRVEPTRDPAAGEAG